MKDKQEEGEIRNSDSQGQEQDHCAVFASKMLSC